MLIVYNYSRTDLGISTTDLILGDIDNPISGYFDEFRIVKGFARWTSAFTVPASETAAGLILDNSANWPTLTDGMTIYFEGDSYVTGYAITGTPTYDTVLDLGSYPAAFAHQGFKIYGTPIGNNLILNSIEYDFVPFATSGINYVKGQDGHPSGT